MPILEVKNLVKSYGPVKAVDDVSFHVEEGQFFAFLGPNGAGKSTTINCICTLLSSDSGSIRVAGFQVGKEDDAVRRSIGIVFQESLLDDKLTVYENLKTRAAFYGMGTLRTKSRIGEIASLLQIEDLLDRRYGKLSGGQKRRCDIARALLNTPKVLFLDEPTTGLDPQTRVKVWETIRSMQRTGLTVFLTTHYMEESSAADSVCVLDHGKLVAFGSPGDLKKRYSSDTLKLEGPSAVIGEKLRAAGIRFIQENNFLRVPLENSLAALPVLRMLEPDLSGFEVVRGNMDDVFINITGHAIREDHA